MVSGEEYVFENIYEARNYILSLEKEALANDVKRKGAPICLYPPRFNIPYEKYIEQSCIPTDNLDYLFNSYFNNAADDKFIMRKLQSGRYSLKPNLKNRKFLFRGQDKFYPKCKPNLFREQNKNDYLDCLIHGDEMVLIILSHPLVQLLDLGVYLDGRFVRFEMNLYGLIQHYYNSTSLLDLTSDINVALFFATQQYDDKVDMYSPVIDDKREFGILYYYDLDIERDFQKQIDGELLSTIGLQVFPRSGRQKGFLYRLNKDANFNDLPQVKAIRFKHNGKIAQDISKQMKSGDYLFPDDILKSHWLNNMQNHNVVSKDAVKINLTRNHNETIESLERKLKSYNIFVEDYKPQFTEVELHEYYNSIKYDGYWDFFCNQIYIPGDANGKMKQDLLNLPQNPQYDWAFKENVQHKIDYSKGFLLRQYQHILS